MGTAITKARQHLTARQFNRSASAKAAGVIVGRHHPDPLALVGKYTQALENLTAGLHIEFHTRLDEALRTEGLPSLKGKSGSKEVWPDLFANDPSLRGKVDAIQEKVSGEIDNEYGSDLGTAFANSVEDR